MSFRRAPLGLKQPKSKPRPDYLAAVRELPCVVCRAYGEPQTEPTAAHHVIHGRYGQRKTPDVQAIPLCWRHHQGPDGVHTIPAEWKARYGLDVDYIAVTQDRLAHLLKVPRRLGRPPTPERPCPVDRGRKLEADSCRLPSNERRSLGGSD